MNFSRRAVSLLCAAALGMSSLQALAADKLQKITVGVIPIVDVSPLYLGVKQGFFAEQGLELAIESGAGGAALIPGVQSGNFEFAFSNMLSLMVARDKGLKLKVVTNGVSTSGNKQRDAAALVVRGDSGITSLKQLEGKVVSTNTLGNIADVAIRTLVEKAGGDPTRIRFTELAFPTAAAALDKGQADAVYLVEPFVSSALAQGHKAVSYLYADLNPGMDISGYFTSEALLAKDPQMVKRFQTAMNKSLEYAQSHPDEVRAIVGTYTKIPPDVIGKIVLPAWRVPMSAEALTLLGDAALKQKAIAKKPELPALMP